MEFLEGIIGAKIATDLFSAFFGAWICFGALKWRKGLMTTIATYWGLFLGLTLGIMLTINLDNPIWLPICVVVGVILVPILTFKVPAVNRFIVGFIVAMKITFMITTVSMKNGDMSIVEALMIPLLIGTLVGIVLMLWTQLSVGTYVIATSFLGAAQTAPSISDIINYVESGITGDIWWDPYDVLFAYFKIELTDFWTLVVLIIMMVIAIVFTYKKITAVIPPNTPMIVYEKTKKGDSK